MPDRSHHHARHPAAWLRHVAIAVAFALPGSVLAASSDTQVRSLSALELMAESDAELARIRTHINDRRLDLAKPMLEKRLQVAPDSVALRRLYAQYHLTEGYRGRNSYMSDSLDAAERHLAHAVRVAPEDAANYVLQGFVFRLLGRRDDARTALARAEQLGSADPWLHLNWGELLLDERDQAPAAARFRKALAIKGLSPGLEAEALRGMATYHTAAGQFDEADRIYKRLMALRGNDAGSQVQYADFLLCARDDYEAAILLAGKVREREDSPGVRLTLAAALFRKWSLQVQQGKAEEAAATFGLTRALVPPHPVAVRELTCRFDRTMDPLLLAMQKTGEGFRIPAADAVQLVSGRSEEDGPAPGIFALTVKGSGREGGRVFLNSAPDYREPLNLTINITPEAAQAFSMAYGAEPDVVLKGRAIEVRGYARKVRIAFRANGMDTGKFYYQTHVIVDDPAQLAFALSRQ